MFQAIVLGVIAGALYTVSPLAAWCVPLAAVLFSFAGRGLSAGDRRTLTVLLATALVIRLAAIGALVVINTPMHDTESVGMLTGDEAYGLSRALRTRDVMTNAPVTSYDYFVSSDEYGRNSYMTFLTALQLLFGPTPYSMRLLNILIFMTAAVLLFRTAHSAFGSLPAFVGLTAMLFLPTLFYWSISLLKEPIYLLGGSMILAGAIGMSTAPDWRGRFLRALVVLAGLAIVRDLRPGAVPLALLGIGAGIALLLFFSLRPRTQLWLAVAGSILFFTVVSRPAAQQRIIPALESAAKTHAGHVFTVGHSYRLLDDGFYFSPAPAASSRLTLTVGEAARYVIRAGVSFLAVPAPWQLAATRELAYLPEQLVWYVMIVLLPFGLVAAWRRNPGAAALFAGYTLPTAAALALTNGNVGTLLRLRGIVIPYLLWLGAVGFCAALQRLAVRTSES